MDICAATNEAIRELSKKGIANRQIVRQTGHSRKLVRDVLRGQRLDVFRTRPSSLESWLPIEPRQPARWRAGCRGSIGAGRKGLETPWRSGARCELRAFMGKAVSSRNGLSANVWPRKPTRVGLRERHRHG